MSADRVAAFRALHHSGCFIMPNPWDAGSARFLETLGFRALASTSAGFAFTRALPDTPGALTIEPVLTHLKDLVDATTLPINADFQAGYAADAEGVARNVTAAVRAGVAGLSIEDMTTDAAKPLFDRATAIARLRAARAAIDATGVPVVLTARCEAFLVGDAEPARTALDRLVAFADAGADCLFAPGCRDPEFIATLVRAVAPKPVNVLISSPGLSLERATELGVRRISVGSALSRVAWGGFMRAARALAAGSFEGMTDAASFDELDALFGAR